MHKLDSKYKAHLVFLTKDSIDILFKALDSVIDKQLYLPGTFTNFKIYIADTGSTQESQDKIKEYINKNSHIDFKYILYDGYHFGKVNNHVIKNIIVKDEEKTDLIVFCNNDIQLLTDCITEFVEFYHKTEKVGTIGCKLLFEDKTIQHAGQIVVSDNMFPTHRALRSPAVIKNKLQYSKVDKVAGNTAALAMIELDLFLDIGGFNEDYEFGFEDMQLSLDCILKGKENYYLGTSVSYHFESLNKERSGFDINERNRLAVKDYNSVFKHYTQKHFKHFKPYITASI